MTKYQHVDSHIHPNKKLMAGQDEPVSDPKIYG